MKLRVFLSLVAFSLVTGCASSKMVVKPDQQLAAPTSSSSQVVFMRSSYFGGAIQASLYDVTTGEPDFIGILSSGAKLAYEVDPGYHVFMVVSEAADFMEANLDGGKTYFAMVTPRMGAWKARFSLHPVRTGGGGEFRYSSNEFQGWLSSTNFVSNTPESETWFRENLNSIKEKQEKYWAVWQEKSREDVMKRTLFPEDGVR